MRTLFVILSLVLLSLTATISKVEPAETVFKNGNIYTVNGGSRAEAVAVKGDRIVFVGSNKGAQKYVGEKTRVIDLHGNTVVPGLTDAHCHLLGVGQREMTLNLEGITNLQDFLAKVKARVDQTKPGEWVTGRGWIETFWQPPVIPTRGEHRRLPESFNPSAAGNPFTGLCLINFSLYLCQKILKVRYALEVERHLAKADAFQVMMRVGHSRQCR